MDGLTVGRIVHVTAAEHDYSTGQRVTTNVCRAAIVTYVDNKSAGAIAVTVFLPDGSTEGRQTAPGTFAGGWHWPERA